jgi:hypothetical protein
MISTFTLPNGSRKHDACGWDGHHAFGFWVKAIPPAPLGLRCSSGSGYPG